MSPREQTERVQRSIIAGRDPLAGTVERFETAMRGRAGRLLLAGLLLGGGGLTAEKAGFLDVIVKAVTPKGVEAHEAAADPRVPALAAAVDANAKETKAVKRLVRWLVNQEIRRQEREGGRVAEPPEDIE